MLCDAVKIMDGFDGSGTLVGCPIDPRALELSCFNVVCWKHMGFGVMALQNSFNLFGGISSGLPVECNCCESEVAMVVKSWDSIPNGE